MPERSPSTQSKRQSWTLGICPRCGETHCSTPNIDHKEHVVGREVIEVVPRIVAQESVGRVLRWIHESEHADAEYVGCQSCADVCERLGVADPREES